MSYEAKATRTYDQPAEIVVELAAKAIADLGGKPSKKSKPASRRLEANFNKKIGNRAFGNRCQVEISVTSQTAEQCALAARVYPVDPIGNPLLFGVRGKPAHLVLDIFLADLDQRVAG
jgi:hypothetical protein